jgi:hypothetical protein
MRNSRKRAEATVSHNEIVQGNDHTRQRIGSVKRNRAEALRRKPHSQRVRSSNGNEFGSSDESESSPPRTKLRSHGINGGGKLKATTDESDDNSESGSNENIDEESAKNIDPISSRYSRTGGPTARGRYATRSARILHPRKKQHRRVKDSESDEDKDEDGNDMSESEYSE